MAKVNNPAIVLAVVGIGGIAAFGYIVANEPKHMGDEAPATSMKHQVKPPEVVQPKVEGVNVKLERKATDQKVQGDPMVFAVNEFLKSLPAVPKEAKCLSVSVKGEEATLDFSKEIVTGYGTDDERLLLDGLRSTMGQYPDVQRIRVFVDGKPIDSLSNADLTAPLSVIRGTKVEAP